MSGGAYDYVYTKVEEMVDLLSREGETPIRRAFAAHLRLVAKALHDIEWVDSGDYPRGHDVEAIYAALGPSASDAELKVLIDDADRAHEALGKALAKRGGLKAPERVTSEHEASQMGDLLRTLKYVAVRLGDLPKESTGTRIARALESIATSDWSGEPSTTRAVYLAISNLVRLASPETESDTSPEDVGAGAEAVSAERAAEREKVKSSLSNFVMWDALARVVGYNELVKDSQNLEEKMYLRLARAEAEKVYVSLGGQIVLSHDKPLIEVPTRPPFIALTDADIELMRKAVEAYDKKKFAETSIKWHVERGFIGVGMCGDAAVARVVLREEGCYLAEVTDLDGGAHKKTFDDQESAYKWCEEVRVAGSAKKEEEKSP